jgi:hypothetical protein
LSRRALGTGLAVCAHILALLALGWRIPRAVEPSFGPEPPPVQVVILRPSKPVRAPFSPVTASAERPNASPAPPPSRVLIAPTPGAPALSGPPKPEVAEGPLDCAVEDLPLLTAAEKARCRNQIDADQARRLAQGADERAAKRVAEADRGPQGFGMDPDKEASYDATARAQEVQRKPPPTAALVWRSGSGSHIAVGVTCSHVNVPLLSGVETNPNLFAKKHKQERPAHGTAQCSVSLR